MLNKTTNERTAIAMVLCTATKGNFTACTTIIHAPSGLERQATAISGDKGRNEVALMAIERACANITGHDLDVGLMTDSKYLRDMFGGDYKKRKLAGETIEFQETWDKIIASLKAHRCHLEVISMRESEVAERAKATARYTIKKYYVATAPTTEPAATESVEEEVA